MNKILLLALLLAGCGSTLQERIDDAKAPYEKEIRYCDSLKNVVVMDSTLTKEQRIARYMEIFDYQQRLFEQEAHVIWETK